LLPRGCTAREAYALSTADSFTGHFLRNMSDAAGASNHWRPRPRLRELSDIVGAGPSRAETALGSSAAADAWTAITSTVDNLVGASMPSQSLALSRHARSRSADVGVFDGEAPPFHLDEERLTQNAPTHSDTCVLPLDQSLKSHLHIMSIKPLAWSAAPRQTLAYAAVQACLAASEDESLPGWALRTMLHDPSSAAVSSSQQRARDEAEFMFARGLLHFRHPSSPLMISVASQWQYAMSNRGQVAAAIPSTRDDHDAKSIALARLDSWQAAFRSLFYGFRYNQVDHFYVILSTTAVLFANMQRLNAETAADDISHDGFVAVISMATPGLLGLLEEHDIPFENSFANCANRNINDMGDDGRHPTLLVRGAGNVQAFFNFVVEVGPILGNATDVPTLISDWPFAGAQIVSGFVRDSRATRTEDGSMRYGIQIDGILTRQQFCRIVKALFVCQDAEFSVLVESERRSTALSMGYQDPSECDAGKALKFTSSDARVISRIICSGRDRTAHAVYTRPG
jgi:hypothetical protein